MTTRNTLTMLALTCAAVLCLIGGAKMNSCTTSGAADAGVDYTEASTPVAATSSVAATTAALSRGDINIKLADGGMHTLPHGLDHNCERGWLSFANEDMATLNEREAGAEQITPVYTRLREKLLECESEEPKLWGPPLKAPTPPTPNTCWCSVDEVRCGPKLAKPDAGKFQSCTVKGQ